MARIVLSMMLLVALALILLLGPAGRFFEHPVAAEDLGKSTQDQSGVACNGEDPPQAAPKIYKRTPRKQLDPKIDYWAVIHTSCGDMKIDLLEDTAPGAVNSFVFLAREGFYDGLPWHVVSHDFIIQTGDPNGQNGVAPDDAGYSVADELPDDADRYTYGAVGLANRGPDTGGSQFFIVVHDLQGALEGKPQPLDIEPKYSLFGEVPKEFFGSLEAIARQQTAGGEDPIEAVKPVAPVYIEHVQIIEDKKAPK